MIYAICRNVKKYRANAKGYAHTAALFSSVQPYMYGLFHFQTGLTSEKTRFSMNLLGNKFSELVVTARISYDSPCSKPDVSVPDIPDLEEYSPEELISMIAPQP